LKVAKGLGGKVLEKQQLSSVCTKACRRNQIIIAVAVNIHKCGNDVVRYITNAGERILRLWNVFKISESPSPPCVSEPPKRVLLVATGSNHNVQIAILVQINKNRRRIPWELNLIQVVWV